VHQGDELGSAEEDIGDINAAGFWVNSNRVSALRGVGTISKKNFKRVA
jgi:hypothetical protein